MILERGAAKMRAATVALLIFSSALVRSASTSSPLVARTREGERPKTPGRHSGHDGYIAEPGGLSGWGESETAATQDRQGSPPPRLYRTLVQHSFGRYVLATSSLVRECARVYMPAPFDLLMSSLFTRVSITVDSKGRYRGASVGKKTSPSGLSYDRFLSHDGTMMEEEELSGEALAMPPEKYGRVSSAFLLRHAVGHVDVMAGKEGAEDVRAIRHPPFEGSKADTFDTGPMQDAISRGTRRSGHPSPSTRSVLESLAGLRVSRQSVGGDDLDLLSDSDNEEHLANLSAVEIGETVGETGREIGRQRARLTRKTPNAHTSTSNRSFFATRTSSPASPSESGVDIVSRSRSGDPNSRNLVSGADDNATALIRKLRQAAAGHKSSRQDADVGGNLRRSSRGRPQKPVDKGKAGDSNQ